MGSSTCGGGGSRVHDTDYPTPLGRLLQVLICNKSAARYILEVAMNTFSTVIISNRLPVSVTKKDDKLVYEASSGGLATAMSSLEADNKTGVLPCFFDGKGSGALL